SRTGTVVRMTDEIGLFEAIYSCRAMRRLHPDPVPEALLVRLIDAANQAPSGRNLQRGRWIIVRDDQQKQRVAELNRRASEQAARAQAEHGEPLAHHDVEKRRRMWGAVLWQSEHLHEVPAIIVACAVLDHPGQDPSRYASSIWPGIQNLLLAARALGLGAVPTTYALRFRDELHEVLGIPNDVAAQAIIPVGFPIGNFGPVTRRPVHEITTFDRWDGPHPAVLDHP
ncbi:MAG: nitroreductase family protein, partial [Ilumatobacteraceae bacterium]